MRLPPWRRRSPARLAFAAALLGAVSLAEARLGAKSVRELTRRLTGSFSSEAQSSLDPDYFDVRVNSVPIWEDRVDGPWMYVEHSVPGDPGFPFRRRVYRLEIGPDGTLLRRSYAIQGALGPDTVTPESLVEAPGCALRFTRGRNDTFVGTTTGRGCRWDAPGVSYVTTDVTVEEDRLILWDRAYDADGRQIWGATKGPYVFRRIPEP